MLTVNAWSPGRGSRGFLIVKTSGGNKVGQYALDSGELKVSPGYSLEDVKRALSEFSKTLPTDDLVVQEANVEKLFVTDSLDVEWEDLSLNAPGTSIAALAETDPKYALGIAGEQRTAGVLSQKPWKVLHSVPLSKKKDLDHLVVTLFGVFAVNTKVSSYPVNVTTDTVRIQGHRKFWISDIQRDALLVENLLAEHLGQRVPVCPVVALWCNQPCDLSSEVVLGHQLPAYIEQRDILLSEALAEDVFQTMRKSSFWSDLSMIV